VNAVCDRPLEELASLLAPLGSIPRPRCTPMDAEWKRRVADEWWGTGYKGSFDKVYPASMEGDKVARKLYPVMRSMILKLRDEFLLPLGGEEACLPLVEDDIAELVEYGQPWSGAEARMKHGEPSRCHENSASLWACNPETTVIATGYGLSPDGMWRQHSWVVDARDESPRIVETTVPRLLYFGIPYTLDRAITMCRHFDVPLPSELDGARRAAKRP
jgi:hypothetical protein